MSAPRAVLTGGTGFIGSRLALSLRRLGWRVDLVLSEPKHGVVGHVHDGDTLSLTTALRGMKPDVVFHLASLFRAEHGPAEAEQLVRANVLFGAQLLEAMCQANVRRLVVAGTSWQHARTWKKAYAPVNLYGATKQAFDDILAYYVQARAFTSVSLKLFDTYGPGDERPKLFKLLRESASPLDMSPGRQLLDVVHVDDAVRAFIVAGKRVLKRRRSGAESFTVSSGSLIRLRDLVDAYRRATGRSVKVRWGARSYRQREVMTPWRGGQRLPGWRPEILLEEGLRGL